MKRLLTVLIFAALLTGCATYDTQKTGPVIDNYTVAEIQTGESTRTWVIEKFGEPSNTEFIGSDEILIYEYTEKQVPTYLSGTVVLRANTKYLRNTLYITIKKDRVASYRYKSNTSK